MTRRMPSSNGVRSLGIPLSHDNVTFVDLMRDAGYDTALIGKSHLQTVTDWPVKLTRPNIERAIMCRQTRSNRLSPRFIIRCISV